MDKGKLIYFDKNPDCGGLDYKSGVGLGGALRTFSGVVVVIYKPIRLHKGVYLLKLFGQ